MQVSIPSEVRETFNRLVNTWLMREMGRRRLIGHQFIQIRFNEPQIYHSDLRVYNVIINSNRIKLKAEMKLLFLIFLIMFIVFFLIIILLKIFANKRENL